MRASTALVAASVLVLAALSWGGIAFQEASAGHCGHTIRLGVVPINGGTADSTFYFDDRAIWWAGWWIYEETNGIWQKPADRDVLGGEENLQRGGSATLDPAMVDPCRDVEFEVPDTLIYGFNSFPSPP